MRTIVPIANMQRRLPEAGRLRTGVKAGKRPKAIPTWRITSHDQEAVAQVASIYGGTPRPWSDSPTPGQWEVITEAAELRIVLPPDPLGSTPIYESWSAGGCQRRCDGLTCQTPISGPDGTEMTDVPCMCQAKGEMVCRPHTRLSVILPDVRFGGTWRYESATSWNVAQEIPGMVDLIQSLQERGLSRALLGIEHRKTVTGGETHRFTIPVLRVADSMDAMLAGAARVSALPTAEPDPSVPAIEAAARPPDLDDEVIDAEVIEDSDLVEATVEGVVPEGTCAVCLHQYGQEPLVRSDGPSRFVHKTCDVRPMEDGQRSRLFVLLNGQGILGDDERHVYASPTLGREVTSFKQLTRGDADRLIAKLEVLPEAEPDPDGPLTPGQKDTLVRELRQAKILGPQRFSWCGSRIKRSIANFDELTYAEAELLLDELANTFAEADQ